MKTFTDDIKREFNKPNNVIVQLIMINVAVWIIINLTGLFGSVGQVVFHSFALPADISSFIFRPWTLITYAFSHASLGHIFFNMLGLYWFGRILQDLIGSNRVLGVYILSGLLGAIPFLIFSNVVPVISINAVLLGASGSVFGVVVALATLQPNYRVHLILIGPIAVKWIAAIFVLLSIFGLDKSNKGGEMCHLAGALMGYIFITQLNKGNDLGRPIVDFIYGIPNIFKRKAKMKVSHRSTKKSSNSSTTTSEGVSQEEIDRILDKISQSGYPSLTKEEKGKLFKYSNRK